MVDDTPWVARAHGHETTYQRNLTTPEEIAAALRTLADQLVEDIRREGRGCARVHLKVRFAPFFTVTRIRKLPEPTYDAAVITQTALELLHKLDDDRPIRLLGVRRRWCHPISLVPSGTTGYGDLIRGGTAIAAAYGDAHP